MDELVGDIEVNVNGSPRTVPRGTTVADLVDALGLPRAGAVAVAVDGTVVSRSAWTDLQLRPGGQVEVLTAVQGG